MFSYKEARRPTLRTWSYVIKFWCDSDHKNITFFTFFIILGNIVLISVNVIKMTKLSFSINIQQNYGHHTSITRGKLKYSVQNG